MELAVKVVQFVVVSVCEVALGVEVTSETQDCGFDGGVSKGEFLSRTVIQT